MNTLIGLALAMLCAGCFAQGQKARPVVVESPDPVIGDLHCAQPRLSVADALYYVPGIAQCDPRD